MSIKKNTIFNLLGAFLPLVVAAFSIPLLIHKVGLDRFGVLSLIWIVVGYLSLFDMGMGRAVTQKIAKNLSASNGGNYVRAVILKKSLIFTIASGILGGLILFFLSELIVDILLSADRLRDEAVIAIKIASLCIPFVTLTSVFKGIFEAYEDFLTVNILKVLLGVMNYFIPVIIALYGYVELGYMVFGLLVIRVFVLYIYVHLIFKRFDFSRLIFKKIPKVEAVEIFGFSFWITVSNIVSPLLVNIDKFVISSVLGISFVAYYSVPSEVVARVSIVSFSLGAALFPFYSKIENISGKDFFVNYERVKKKMFGVLFVIFLIGCTAIYPGFYIWLGNDFAKIAWAPCLILLFGSIFNGVAQIPYALIQARGYAKFTGILHCIEFLIYLPILYILTSKFGVLGCALAWTLRVAIDYISLNIYAEKIILNYAK